jgi:hypothetical protein
MNIQSMLIASNVEVHLGRSSKARLYAHFAQKSAETRKHVACDGVFKSTGARFAQASAATRKHVTCDGV